MFITLGQVGFYLVPGCPTGLRDIRYRPCRVGTLSGQGYDKRLFLITVLDDIFSIYFTNLVLEDCLDKNLEEYYINGYFINTSYHEKNNLILLGTTNVNYQPSVNTNFVISTGAYKGLIVENVTKNWKQTIIDVNGIFRHVILDDIPSYDSNDFFIIYKEPTILKNETNKNFFENGIENFTIFHNNTNNLQKSFYKSIDFNYKPHY